MNEILLLVEVVLAACVVLALFALIGTLLRRRAIAQGQPLIVCALRQAPAHRWRYGLARYDSTALDWFTLFGMSLRPRHSWDRARLDFGQPTALPAGAVAETLIPSPLLVPCELVTERFDLALSRAPYTALRTWLEASPPGQHIDVA